MTNFSPLPSESAATNAISVRLLSSVAVVGRENEPIYLRGDLCDFNNTINSSSAPTTTSPATTPRQEVQTAGGASSSVITDDEENEANTNQIIAGEGGGDEDGDSLPSNNSQGGLFGRIKGAVGMNTNNNDADDDATDEKEEKFQEQEDDDDNDEDPFGFFENNNSSNKNNNKNSSGAIPSAMSLTQQLVLHASLDRFEEMASRSSKGGAVRWRNPGSNSTNAMWMGLLCQVEERWNVYGYLTNTGIKFMILVENVYLNQDGSRFRQDHAPPSSSSLLSGNNTSLPSSPKSNGSSREADLKNMFAQLHELYVRYTMNPFSQLRSPIQSSIFDNGIVQMAQSFNSLALEQISSLEGDYAVAGLKKNGLVWM